jgi:imidazolonepropionase-like amidohydrolase
VRTVLEVDGLFDGERAITNAAIAIDDGKIAWSGKRSALPKAPRGERAEIAKAPGTFVLPGFINCHCHLTLDGEANLSLEARQNDSLAAFKAFRNARAALRAGVTTVRDVGASGAMVIELGRAIERGVIEGPRVIAAGRGITSTGGHGLEVGRIADGADEVRKAVREQVHAGAKVIKIFSTGGILGEGAPPDVSQFTLEETKAAVEEAHKAGVRITTHAHSAGGMRIAIQAGVDSIDHATLLDQRTVRELKERDIAIVPTLCAVYFILENAATLPSVVVERTRAVSAKHREGVRMAHKAGVRIATGTDAGSSFNRHDRFAVELRLLAECGLAAEEVLAAATSRAAGVVGREYAGRVSPGCEADFVFVNGDPLADVALLARPAGVYIRGAAVV